MARLLKLIRSDVAKLLIAMLATAIVSYIFGPETAAKVWSILGGG